jgi:hypothetical protein
MQYMKHSSSILAAAVLLAGGAVALANELAATDAPQASVWQHHQSTFSYLGITARYTCDGLEDKVRELLLYFGARKDLKVEATGCPSPNRPSTNVWVSVDFYSLAAADSTATDTVPGRWSNIVVAPERPTWMGRGECEVMDQMKGLLTKSFSMRDMDYRTSCFPHEVTIGDYSIKGEILKSAAGKAG